MANDYQDEGIAIGIGPQADRSTVNTAVRTAVDLIAGAATGTDATGIYLADATKLQQSYTREESEGGTLPGVFTRVSGALKRVVPAVSFDIDWVGCGVAGGVADADYPEAYTQLLQGARLDATSNDPAGSVYEFVDNEADLYKTLKIWRGGSAFSESWVLTGCTFNLSWAFEAGEKCVCTVTVFADSVEYNPVSSVFPPVADPATEYGFQLASPPLLASAGAKFDNLERGFQSGTISVEYNVETFGDSNASGGKSNSQAGRTVNCSMNWIVDTASADFDHLKDDTFTGDDSKVYFELGTAGGDPVIGTVFEIPHLRVTSEEKVDSSKMVRKIQGYAVYGAGAAANKELAVSTA